MKGKEVERERQRIPNYTRAKNHEEQTRTNMLFLKERESSEKEKKRKLLLKEIMVWSQFLF